MKTLTYILLLLTVATACTTQQRCAKKFPPEIITKDSLVFKEVIKTVVIHDTVFIHADTVLKTDTVLIKNGLIYSRPVFARVEFARAKAQVVNSRLLLNLFQNDSAITRRLQQNIKVVEKEVYKTKTITVKQYVTKWYHTAALWIAIPVVVAFIGFLVYIVIKIMI